MSVIYTAVFYLAYPVFLFIKKYLTVLCIKSSCAFSYGFCLWCFSQKGPTSLLYCKSILFFQLIVLILTSSYFQPRQHFIVHCFTHCCTCINCSLFFYRILLVNCVIPAAPVAELTIAFCCKNSTSHEDWNHD